jgi:hypothetical protein
VLFLRAEKLFLDGFDNGVGAFLIVTLFRLLDLEEEGVTGTNVS